MKRRIYKGLSVIAAGGLMFTLSACGGDSDDSDNGSEAGSSTCPSDLSGLTVGFVAVGPEGGWRDANESNIQKEFKDAGADLKYSGTADNDQANQLKAFSSFVDEEVDLILLSATEATGWENSLLDAQEAEIPVILIDRMIDPDEPDLYVQRLAPNNQEVAANAANWANEELPDGGNYVVLEGPTGVSVVNERNEGWDSAIDGKFNKLEAQTANWSTEEGKSVFASMLNSHNNDIQLVFAQNDEMGLGAVQAVEEAGLTPGEDVKIITIDGTTPALQALVDGKLSLVAEYNPIFGADAVDTALSALCGEDVEKNYVVESAIYDSVEDAQAAIDDPDRGF